MTCFRKHKTLEMAGVFPPVIIQNLTIKCTPNYILYKKLKPEVWEWIMSFNWKDKVTLQVLSQQIHGHLKINEWSFTDSILLKFAWEMKNPFMLLYIFWVRVQQIKMLSVSIHLYEPQKICRELNKSTNIFVNFFKQIIYLWNNLRRKFVPHALDILHMPLIDTICTSSKALIAFF